MFQKPKEVLFTKQGMEDIQEQYTALKAERPSAVEHLKKSRELGDLRENGYYKASRQRLNYIDSQILRLGHLIKHGVVAQKTQTDLVELGSTVTLVSGTEKMTYTIVGEHEANPSEGKISFVSPLGSKLIGRKRNETVTIDAPVHSSYKIIEIK